MANYQSLKAAINAVIKANGNKEITGTVLNEVLLAMVNSLGAGYQFAGVATPSTNPGTPDQKVFYIASQAGTYTNFGGAVVSDGIAIFEWNGTWTTETLDLSMAGQVQSDWTETDTTKKSYIKHKPNIPPSANVDTVPKEDSPNAVSSGGTYDMIVNTAATLFGDIQDATNVNAIESVDGKIYNDYQAGDIFFIVDNNVRKYRVALVAGTADAEHPVTISPVNFYYALNSADAINLSLTLKTVSTEQQSLSTKQKAQARSNIAAVSYEQQSLNADQQVQAQNNMMGKSYVPSQNSGLGKVYLDKNNGVLTQSMMQAVNTVYVIQYDYTMSGNITVPAGCTLEFDGGSIKGNYTLTGNNTRIKASDVAIFSLLTIAGTWNVDSFSACWFGVNKDASNNLPAFSYAIANTPLGNTLSLPAGSYTITNSLVINRNINIQFEGDIISSNSSHPVVIIDDLDNNKYSFHDITGTPTFNYDEDGYDYNVGIVLKNARNNDITIHRINSCCAGIILYADNGKGTHYNTIVPSFISACFRAMRVVNIDDGWVNGNNVYDCSVFYNSWGSSIGANIPCIISCNSYVSQGEPYLTNSNSFIGISAEYGVDADALILTELHSCVGYEIDFKRIEVVIRSNTFTFGSRAYSSRITAGFSNTRVAPFNDDRKNYVLPTKGLHIDTTPTIVQVIPTLVTGASVKFGKMFDDYKNRMFYINLTLIFSNDVAESSSLIANVQPVDGNMVYQAHRGQDYGFWTNPEVVDHIPLYITSDGKVKNLKTIPAQSHLEINVSYHY